MNKRIFSLLIAGLMMFVISVSAFADSYVHITDKSDPRINEMLTAISKQNFKDSGTTASEAINWIEHVIYNARFAAIGGGPFNYPNSGSYVSEIDDGTYKVGIRGAKGCYAYANYVTNLVYGEEKGTLGLHNEIGRQHHTPDTLKSLLVSQAQAGEHLRIGDVHSVAFVSADENGFYCISYQNINYENNIELQYWTYEDFLNFSYYNGYEIFLFNTNTAVNSDVEACYTNGELSNPFTDINNTMECYDAVLWIYHSNITNGVTGSEFNVNGQCTRAQAVTFIWRAAHCPEPKLKICSFSDVKAGEYCYDAVIWAKEQGICNGYDDGKFHPYDTVTRSQFVTLLWRATNQPEPISLISPFNDVDYSNYFYKAVLWGNENGIIKGYAGRFMPNDPCTRGHVAMFLYRYLA